MPCETDCIPPRTYGPRALYHTQNPALREKMESAATRCTISGAQVCTPNGGVNLNDTTLY